MYVWVDLPSLSFPINHLWIWFSYGAVFLLLLLVCHVVNMTTLLNKCKHRAKLHISHIYLSVYHTTNHLHEKAAILDDSTNLIGGWFKRVTQSSIWSPSTTFTLSSEVINTYLPLKKIFSNMVTRVCFRNNYNSSKVETNAVLNLRE